MSPEIAEAAGAGLVSKNELFRQADIVTIHLILSDRTRIWSGCGPSIDEANFSIDQYISQVHRRRLYRTFNGDAVASITA
jgi:hypothetical protein